MMNNVAKNFDILVTNLKIILFRRNVFDSSIKLFSDLYPAKFLDTSAKSFIPYRTYLLMQLISTILRARERLK